jgi:non-structural maintenance of chromosomes element 4
VRTTSVANLDSKLLVTASDLAKQKARNIELGDAAFNVDEYITKLVEYMGGRNNIDSAEANEHALDWAKLGKLAMGICRRPPTMGFVLGPLSVEKKVRKVARRQAEKLTNAAVVRPQEVPPPLTPVLFFTELTVRS